MGPSACSDEALTAEMVAGMSRSRSSVLRAVTTTSPSVVEALVASVDGGGARHDERNYGGGLEQAAHGFPQGWQL